MSDHAAVPPTNASPTGDPAVDAIVARAAQAATRPTQEHNPLYAGLADALQEELDADPDADPDAGLPDGTA
ncbi:hypothetical protein [Specibacter sp. RAF43]|uniref:hypothetical protein n=1 Tax=Specibacter sp. RAF43 TaxID=3233057 RepID=UPI003F99E083